MKKLWLILFGCFVFILVGCHSNKEISEENQEFPLLNHFIKIVHEVKDYDTGEREKFIEEALLLKESTPSNPLLKDLTNEFEAIGFTEGEVFLEDNSDHPINSLDMKYTLKNPSKSLFFILTYRMDSTNVSDDFQLALRTTDISDSSKLSSIFKLGENDIEGVFESLIPVLANQTPIEKETLISQLQEVNASYEEKDGGQKQSYSIYDKNTLLTISYNLETKLIDLMTYNQDEFEKSSYYDDNQVYLSITSPTVNHDFFETTIYEPLVMYLDEKVISDHQ